MPIIWQSLLEEVWNVVHCKVFEPEWMTGFNWEIGSDVPNPRSDGQLALKLDYGKHILCIDLRFYPK